MSDFKDNYTIGVGKTVLELFKKVLEKKKELQTGGAQTPAPAPAIGTVTLTKVEQYYDGTIFEGSITGGDEYDIQFNIKDRTKTTLSGTDTPETAPPK